MNKYILNLKRIFIIGIFAQLFVSCSDFLDKNPLDQIASETFWTSDKEVQMALTGVSSRLQVAPFQHDDCKADVMGGDVDSNQGQGWVPIAQGNILPTSGSLITEIWTNCYAGISSCNFFLDNIDKAPITADNYNKYTGEVRFLRALFYFKLADVYSGVPLYTSAVTIEESKIKQSTKAEIIAQVISDLDYAIANLPDVKFDGHAVKGSAQALKARVFLYESQWSEAAAMAKEIMDGGVFSIYSDFRKLFLATGQTANPEIIFSTKFLNPDSYSDFDIRWNWHGVVNPRKELQEAFECSDGLPITESPLYVTPTPESPNSWKQNRDKRLEMTLKPFQDSAINSAGKKVAFNYNVQQTNANFPVKYGNWDCLPIDYSTKSEQDWILLRYAEVLLTYAEAQNEAIGPDQSVYDAVNEVRSRPGIEMPLLPAGLTKDEMRERIRNERRVELALEGLRWSDIKRWKTAETYIPTLIDQGGVQRTFEAPTHYIMPIPQSEIDINPQLEQNPGY